MIPKSVCACARTHVCLRVCVYVHESMPASQFHPFLGVESQLGWICSLLILTATNQ